MVITLFLKILLLFVAQFSSRIPRYPSYEYISIILDILEFQSCLYSLRGSLTTMTAPQKKWLARESPPVAGNHLGDTCGLHRRCKGCLGIDSGIARMPAERRRGCAGISRMLERLGDPSPLEQRPTMETYWFWFGGFTDAILSWLVIIGLYLRWAIVLSPLCDSQVWFFPRHAVWHNHPISHAIVH